MSRILRGEPQIVGRTMGFLSSPDTWNKGGMDLSGSMWMELGFGNQHRPQNESFAQRRM